MKFVLAAFVLLLAGRATATGPLPFGTLDGKPVYLYLLRNRQGDTVKITNYGATLTQWICADRNGKRANIVLGFDSLSGYLQKEPYFGATVGRFANRIARGRFSLDGHTYTLAVNNGPNHLHGGNKGFDKVLWTVDSYSDSSLALSYQSVDGEEGYPGNLAATVRFAFSDSGLRIDYTARTDKPTVVNFTNHSYYNLSGDPGTTVLGHQLRLFAAAYTPVDSTQIPTGRLQPVAGTPFDFRRLHAIGDSIDRVPGGYDHNFILSGPVRLPHQAAFAWEPVSGRTLAVWTTEPGLQFYTGNFLKGNLQDNRGIPYRKHSGFCLETQHFPDAPNQPRFPSTLLRPGQVFHSTTIVRTGLR